MIVPSLRFHQAGQEQAQGRPIGNEHKGHKQQKEKGQGCLVELDDGSLKPGARDKEVKAYWWGIVADTEVGEKYNPQMDRIDSESRGERHDQGDHDQDSAEYVHHAAHQDQEEIKGKEKCNPRTDDLFHGM